MRWTEFKFSNLAEKFISGGTPNTKVKLYWNGDIPWITGADFTNGEIILGRRFINQNAVSNSATNIVPKGSIVMVTRTGVGKIAITQEDTAISQDITFRRPFLNLLITSHNPHIIGIKRPVQADTVGALKGNIHGKHIQIRLGHSPSQMGTSVPDDPSQKNRLDACRKLQNRSFLT